MRQYSPPPPRPFPNVCSFLPQPHCYYAPGGLLNPAVCECPKAHRGLQSRTRLAGYHPRS
ncbi:mCG146967 [Mus musculus]|nr:mCG146967 [Mus musculus]